jgi:precorrin isomerase
MNMLFNPEESIDFNGNTGPFIQYTYARIRSILRKAEDRPTPNPSRDGGEEASAELASGNASLPLRGDLEGSAGGGASAGQQIMNESFRTIRSEMQNPDVPVWRLWRLLHAIHTTVDFGMEECLWMDERATEILYNKVKDGTLRHIVTDVTMAASGIRKGALERLGIEVHCYINDPRSKQMADEKGITRSQACMQLAAEEYPDALYVVGNAPTALFEICDLVRKGRMHPAGIIAAPVGFVHVCESKHAVKTLKQIPKIIVEGRKGGSNLAATLCNAILTFDDAEQLKPGRDL